MHGLDPIPGRDARLVGWCQAFRRAGYSIRAIADLFNITVCDLVEAGVQP